MRDIETEIQEKLDEIEACEGVKILHAVESDSLPDDHNRNWSTLNQVFRGVIMGK